MKTKWVIWAVIGIFALPLVLFSGLTILSKPTQMTLNVPGSKHPDEPIDPRKTLFLYVGENKVYVLDRLSPEATTAFEALRVVSSDSPTLVPTIRAVKQQAETSIGNDSLVFVIKPLPTSTYKNMVDVLDVMAILKVKKYALVDELTEAEKALTK